MKKCNPFAAAERVLLKRFPRPNAATKQLIRELVQSVAEAFLEGEAAQPKVAKKQPCKRRRAA